MGAAAIDTVVEIDTPEHLVFRTRLAGPARRMMAWLLDSLVIACLLIALVLSAQLFDAAGFAGYDDGILLLGLFLLWWGYFFVSEMATGGRSVGKTALSLRVVQGNGLPVTWKGSLLRNTLRAVDLSLVPSLFLVLGPLVMAWDRRFRRLGDLAADTLVIVEDRSSVDDAPRPEVSSELLAHLPPRISLDREELEALELFVMRDRMGTERREELAQMLAPALARRLHLEIGANASAFLLAVWARATEDETRGRP